MPLKVEIHSAACPRSERYSNDGPCNCIPTQMLLTGLNDPEVMAAIHGGQPFRLKILGIVPPQPNFATYRPPQERSQADRHRAISD